MDRELVNFDIEKKAKYFWKYLEKISQKEIINFIEDLSVFSHVFIFSGIIRNFFLEIEDNARDIDIVYQGDDDELLKYLQKYNYRTNSFNGYKILIGEYEIDLWKIDSTWAIKNTKLGIELFNQYVLPNSAFFNFSSIVYDYFNEKFIFSERFIEFVNSKTLDLVLEDNPLPELCIVNTFYYKDKYGLKISDSLKNFCIRNFKLFHKRDFDNIQLKHFNEIKYPYFFLEENVEIFKDKLLSLLFDLDLLGKKELCFLENIVKVSDTNFLNNKAKEIILKNLKPDAFLCVKGEPLILFFDKSNITENEGWELKIWNFNQSAIVFINENNQWKIKNGFKILKNGNGLEEISQTKISDFEYLKILSGETWEKLGKNFQQENRVDFYLLNNISEFRNVLISKFNLESSIANSLIGRGIFIRYLIDRGIDLDRYEINDKEDFNNILLDKGRTYKLFRKILDDFKGNLFPLSYIVNNRIINEEDEVSNEHLEQLTYLLHGGKIEKNCTTQLSLINLYDFSIIPIEFISNIYERFIGQANQADSGAYYTPLFLVDFIQNETITKYFNDNPTEVNCKILDPACGSGVFLVEAYRKIILQYKLLNPDYNENDQKYDTYKNSIKELLQNNIFGIDQDENAINIAVFSLYITLLDNLEPKSIKGFKFPLLIDVNFYNSDFFNKRAKFNLIFENIHFHFILGNPPWKTKHSKEKQLFENYIENRKLEENSNLEIENREIAEAFLVRVSDFNFNEAGLIIVSKILYKLSRKKERGIFRKYFLSNFSLRKIVELSSVRHQIFNNSSDAAIAPASILFYSNKDDNSKIEENIVTHISIKPNIFFELFKLIVVEKYDVKQIFQKFFIQDDWLWKVFVYGNILDYQFVKRFKKEKTIYEYIENEDDFLFGKGISVGGGDENDITEHREILNSINSKQKGLKTFNITYSENFLKDMQYVHRPRKIDLFRSNVLLVGKGITKDFKAKAAISFEDVIYTDAITGIKPLNESSEDIIYTLESLFNSELFSYFLVETNSSIGIEREQSHDKDDKFSIPLIIDKSGILKSYSQDIKKIYLQKNIREFSDYENHIFQIKIDEYKNKIEDYLLKLYQISSQEKSLIEYARDITIPLLKGDASRKKKIIRKISYKDLYLNEYANIFYDHFSKRFNSQGSFFQVEILWSEFIILMKFNIIPEISTTKIIWNKLENNNIITFLLKLGFENLSKNLFLQKDIKGFEDDFFYLAKPNQYKSWHEALAYLDLAEFIETFYDIDNN